MTESLCHSLHFRAEMLMSAKIKKLSASNWFSGIEDVAQNIPFPQAASSKKRVLKIFTHSPENY